MELQENKFDKELLTIPGLTWLPWVGQNFAQSTARTFVLGESHYNWGEEKAAERLKSNDFTRSVLKGQGLLINREKSNWPLFRNVERALFQKKEVSAEERNELWLSVAYNNLVQRPMGTNKKRPSVEDYYKGWGVFLASCKVLGTKKVLVLGSEAKKLKALDQYVKKEARITSSVKAIGKVGRYKFRKATLQIDGQGTIELWFIRHPSSFFSWRNWGAALNDVATFVK
jgi:hypothetical protein